LLTAAKLELQSPDDFNPRDDALFLGPPHKTNCSRLTYALFRKPDNGPDQPQEWSAHVLLAA
jgi:hypothetical protein